MIDNSKKVDSQEFEELLSKHNDEILDIIRKYNDVSDLILFGVLTVNEPYKFGFFREVIYCEGKKLKYPNEQDINDIFIYNPDELVIGERYYFRCQITSKKERIKKGNPYLLETTFEKVKQCNQVNNLTEIIKDKTQKIEQLNQSIKDYNQTIKDYDQTVIDKYNEVAQTEYLLSQLMEKIELNKNKLNKLNHQKLAMENTINILKQRINICKKLEFVSEKDEEKYLDLLTGININFENHLSFETDFQGNVGMLANHIHNYLFHQKNLIYTKNQISNFLTLLRTHDLIVLSGLSGSGKTKIVKAFAEVLGGVAKIIPVKPNWTSSDDLIGYYNPIQMSFLPTPFTEAIIEAIFNPNQLYFICLDEMNLARVEYYFADFLSKLEERNFEPEIELYAKHEEELFISEFNTLLNAIESSIEGIEIKSWQDFLNNKEARTRFFEMLGNTDQESVLQLHAKIKRRLIDVLKFPSTIKIPNNVRFIGAINVDETTHYFSPKILDRVHIVKFENPLLYEEQVTNYFEKTEYNQELKPVYVSPNMFSQRGEYPKINDTKYEEIANKLKEINREFLLPLNIDFGVRSIRQSLNYVKFYGEVYGYLDFNYYEYRQHEYETDAHFHQLEINDISLNMIIIQKVLPRFLFDSNEIAKNGDSKLKVLKNLLSYLNNLFSEEQNNYIDKTSSKFLSEMIEQAEKNNPQINFFA